MNCYICGCARNCEPFLPLVLENIKKIAACFDQYKVLIAYDDSHDNTYDILQKSDLPITLIRSKKPLSRTCRTQNISNARNAILEKIRAGPSYDYIIMMDMDDVNAGDIHIDVLKKALNNSANWDSISFNRHFYYDIWALSIEPFVFSCWHWANDQRQFENTEVTQIMYHYISQKLKNETKPIECFSAFNGFAIYKTPLFINCQYNHDAKINLDIIPKELINQNIRVLQRSIFMNFNEECEHRHFHFRAVLDYQARIRISPDFLFEEYFN